MRAHPLLPRLSLLCLLPGGCTPISDMLPIPGGFPADGRIEGAVQVRVSPEAFALVQRDPVALVQELFPDGLDIALPPQCEASPHICCADPDPLCRMEVDVTAASLAPSAPGAIDLSLRLGLRSVSALDNDFPLSFDILGVPVHCAMSLQTDRAGTTDLEFSATVQMGVHPEALTAHVSLVDPRLANLDSGDFVLSGDPLCGLADALKPLFTGMLSDELARRVSSMLDGMLCIPCDADAPLLQQCGPFSTHCEEGSCMAGDICLQRLGIEARAQGQPTNPERLDAALDLYAVAGGYVYTAGGGLNVGFLAGAEPARALPHPCLPVSTVAEPPTLRAVDPSPLFTGAAPVPHHVAVGMHETLLNRGAWAAWRAGQLCLELWGTAADGLTTELLAAVAPSVRDLTGQEPEPLRISLRPQQPPALSLGPNITTLDARGLPVLVEPLLTAHLADLVLEVHGRVDGRHVRLLAMSADVTLQIALHVGPAGHVTAVLGSLEDAADNVRVTSSGLLAEQPEVLARTFSTLLVIAEPLLARALPAVELPGLLGLPLVIERGGLTCSPDRAFLAAYARLLGLDADEPPAEPVAEPATLRQLAGLLGPGRHHGLPVTMALIAPLLCLIALRRRQSRVGLPALLLAAMVGLWVLSSLGCTSERRGPRAAESPPSGPEADGPQSPPAPAVRPGQIGRHSDLTAVHGVVLISAHEAGLGDLVLGVLDTAAYGAREDTDAGVELTWRVVDGLPGGAAGAPLAGYRGGVRQAGPDVGQHTSVAARPDGAAAIAYFDRTYAALRFAMAADGSNDTFAAHAVDFPASDNPGAVHTASAAARVGLYTSLALDRDGRPIIAYHATGVPGPAGSIVSELRVAHARSAAPQGPDDWHVTTVERSDSADGVGLWPSLAVAPDGSLLVAYYARATGDLKLAAFDGARWAVKALDTSADVGAFASLAVDPEGRVHITYQDNTYGRLLYISVTDGAPSAREIVDDGAADDGSHVVGADSSLLVDGDRVFVVYQDQRAVELRLAKRSSEGTWTHAVLRGGPAGGGFHARITALARGHAWVSHFVYDLDDTPFGRLETFPLSLSE